VALNKESGDAAILAFSDSNNNLLYITATPYQKGSHVRFEYTPASAVAAQVVNTSNK
jgi:hypothetical protein